MTQYDFTALSPADFELLMRDLIGAEYGWTLESFASGPDGGIDLRKEDTEQKIVVQCKHYAGSRFSDLTRAAIREIPNIQREKPTKYILATTQDLSRTQKDKLRELLHPWLNSTEQLLARADINRILRAHPEIERHHFKLWMSSVNILQRIIQSGIWTRSESLLETIDRRTRLYVTGSDYELAANILETRHSLVLSGLPGVGKSMLAEMLALNYWNQGWQIIIVNSSIEEGWKSWQRTERQLFLFDDFLGQTDIRERSTLNEGASIERFISQVIQEENKRFVLTTRTHILRQAHTRSEPLKRSVDNSNEYILTMDGYHGIERARILYNHLYFSSQSRQVVSEFAANRSEYRAVINHPSFSPRIVEQILKQPHPTGSKLASALIRTFERPIDLWAPSFENSLSPVARDILLLLLCYPVEGVPEQSLRKSILRNADPVKYRHAMKSLEGSWIDICKRARPSSVHVKFANPSCRDFILSYVDENPGYLDFYLTRVTCLDELVHLLKYAISKDSGSVTWKFPGLHSDVAANRNRVGEALASLWPSDISTRMVHPNTSRLLQTLIELDEIFDLRGSSWLPRALIIATASGKFRHSPSVESAEYLTRYLMNHISNVAIENLDLSAIQSALRIWLLEWANVCRSDDDWHSIANITPTFEGTILDQAEPLPLMQEVRTAALIYYSRELNDLTRIIGYDHHDVEMRVHKILRIATRLGIVDMLHSLVEDIRSSLVFEDATDGYIEEPREQDQADAAISIGTTDSSHSTPNKAHSFTKDEIDQMFSTLT